MIGKPGIWRCGIKEIIDKSFCLQANAPILISGFWTIPKAFDHSQIDAILILDGHSHPPFDTLELSDYGIKVPKQLFLSSALALCCNHEKLLVHLSLL